MSTEQFPVVFDTKNRIVVFDTVSQNDDLTPHINAVQFCVVSTRMPVRVTLAPEYEVGGYTEAMEG